MCLSISQSAGESLVRCVNGSVVVSIIFPTVAFIVYVVDFPKPLNGERMVTQQSKQLTILGVYCINRNV